MPGQESAAEIWSSRYGTTLPEDVPDFSAFWSHRSVRKFSDEPVPESLISGLVAAAQSASTSSNLQLWSIVSVQDAARRKQIADLCSDQDQVHHAPWFFAFIADHHRIRQASRQVDGTAESLDYTEFALMAYIDVALAAERFVCAAESAGLGVCYIGAMRNHPLEVRALLGLPDGTFSPFGLCVGYPDLDRLPSVKPRLSQEVVWFKESYDPEAGIGDYDQRMEPFYAKRGLGTSWRTHSSKRISSPNLEGRETLKEFLISIGFGVR